jgi:hypothetical protein
MPGQARHRGGERGVRGGHVSGQALPLGQLGAVLGSDILRGHRVDVLKQLLGLYKVFRARLPGLRSEGLRLFG